MSEERLSDYDFTLPEALIALRPVHPRPASRLLLATPGAIADRVFSDLATILRPGDCLVFNNTRVIPAQLSGTRQRETPHGSGIAAVDIQLLSPCGAEAEVAADAAEPGALWTALARPAKRLAVGDVIGFGAGLAATVAAKGARGAVTLRFDRAGAALDQALGEVGRMPLPPYIARRRAAAARDRADYQTVFAAIPGAVAAPTASQHFDADLLARLAAAGIGRVDVTQPVGAGPFLPVTSDDPALHKMHAEWGQITPEAAARIKAARAAGGRIVAAGTTALRLLESAAAATGQLEAFEGETDLFIRPGFQFRATDGLITNFHLPKSTLLMLVSAFMGRERMRQVYNHAINERYRFFSYGDSSLLLPKG